MKNVLFICSQNMLRSPTAEKVFATGHGVHTHSAGTDVDAEEPVSAEIIEWADIVVVMEDHHRRKLLEAFPAELSGKRLVVLRIRDDFEYMDPKLVEKLHATASLWKDALAEPVPASAPGEGDR